MRSSSRIYLYTLANTKAAPGCVLPSLRCSKREIRRETQKCIQGYILKDASLKEVIIICSSSHRITLFLCDMRASDKSERPNWNVFLSHDYTIRHARRILNNKNAQLELKEPSANPRHPPTQPTPGRKHTHTPSAALHKEDLSARLDATNAMLKCPWPKRNPIMLRERGGGRFARFSPSHI
jgi:hypothetical protein